MQTTWVEAGVGWIPKGKQMCLLEKVSKNDMFLLYLSETTCQWVAFKTLSKGLEVFLNGTA